MDNLKVGSRTLNPWDGKWYVMCEDIYIGGMRLKFRDQVPTFVDLFHLHTHFYNGVVGTLAEVNSLLKPVELYYDNPIGPVAMFVKSPTEVQAPLEAEKVRGVFAIENAKLLSTKADLIGYAAEFDIEIKKSSCVSIKKMLISLEEQAIEKGLLPTT